MERLREVENVRVIFVSYADASKPLQRMWIEEWTKKYCASDKAILVLDPQKTAYQAFSIPSSVLAGWGLANIWYYAKAILTCRTRSVQVRGEAGQLGADFCLAPGDEGTCVLAHYCKNPTDRVSVDKIVEVIKSFSN